MKISRKSYSAIQMLKKTWFGKNISLILTIAATISAIATYWTITHSSSPVGPSTRQVLPLLLANLVLLLTLGTIIAWKLSKLILARHKGSVGSRLQIRIIVMFSMVSITPTIIVALFSAIFFNYGIQSWFDERVETALSESVAVAEGYFEEHRKNIRADALAMANDLNKQSTLLAKNAKRFKQVITTQAALRNLSQAIIFQRSKILAKTDLSFALMFEIKNFPDDIFDKAANGQVVILTNDQDDRVKALIKLDNFFDTYLLVGRFVDSKVLNHMERTKGSALEYKNMKDNISNLQIKFYFVFIAVSLLVLLSAIWIGIIFAGEILRPIVALISATERVKSGDLDTRIIEGPKNDEISTLGRAFNRMTGQLQKQRNELIEVNYQINNRRRFIEAVLSGVSAGIIAVDTDKNITLYNKSALTLLSPNGENITGEQAFVVLPEINELLNLASSSSEIMVQKEISIIRDDKKSTFLFRIVREEMNDDKDKKENKIEGYIITFDDITELVTAQRSAAWSDVARRIAHEIKNPLTPIHLAADRLKSKYENETSDPETFNKYIGTITRHVDNIGKIIEEFVNFARMPTPKLSEHNIYEIVREAVFSEQLVNPDIKYHINTDSDNSDYIANCDKGQIAQVMTNLLKNATESITTDTNKNGEISIKIKKNNYIQIEIKDNGDGLPSDLLNRITEPYITTKKNGTGLGLAIVKKVMDDHDGKLLIDNIIENQKIIGAIVTLSLPTVEI